ncbi:uncharacterized protein LOC134239754 [Saccostrea cucullata]|uniref:uncharacterized protein LOC134239754 n=1 Tax=Saccostrea cuccullata TaxID=36930 RepID=UPI002ED428AF
MKLALEIMIILKSACRLILQPIFLTSIKHGSDHDGQVASKLFLSHVLAGLFVIFGVVSGENTSDDTVVLGKWAVLTVSVSFGLISILSLLISSCRKRQITQCGNTNEDPSIHLQLGFLWIFSLAFVTYLSLKIIIFLECVVTRPDDTVFNSFLFFSNLIYFLFIVSQIVLLTYYKRTQLKSSFHLHFSIVCIISANFSLWYSSTIHNMFANGNSTGVYNNSCFHASEIQRTLGRKVSSMLLPPQLEFCILASALLLTLWQQAQECKTNEVHSTYCLLSGDVNAKCVYVASKGINGIYILALIFGMIINSLHFISTVLLNFAYEWKNKNMTVVYDVGQILYSISVCVIVYVCSHQMKLNFMFTRRSLIFREYILIFSSVGIMAFFTFEVLAGFSGISFSKFIIFSSTFGMLETFLQTLLLINSSRFKILQSGSKVISSCSIILVITNLTYWLENSYNKGIVLLTRNNDNSSFNFVDIILVPLIVFYRFFSGISAYSMYKRFKIK